MKIKYNKIILKPIIFVIIFLVIMSILGKIFIPKWADEYARWNKKNKGIV